MGTETKRAISIAIGVAAGILIANAVTFGAGVLMAKIAINTAAQEIAELQKEAKSRKIQETLKQIKKDRQKAAEAEMIKKESSDICRFWRQQKGKNENAEERIKQHCYTGPDPKSL